LNFNPDLPFDIFKHKLRAFLFSVRNTLYPTLVVLICVQITEVRTEVKGREGGGAGIQISSCYDPPISNPPKLKL